MRYDKLLAEFGDKAVTVHATLVNFVSLVQRKSNGLAPVNYAHRAHECSQLTFAKTCVVKEILSCGTKYVGKVPCLAEASDKALFFVSVAIGALSDHLREAYDAMSKSEHYLSFLYFEILDENENTLYAPLDLLHPSANGFGTLSYFGSNSSNPAGIRVMDFENVKFVVAKQPTDYTTFDTFLTSTLGVFYLAVSSNAGNSRYINLSKAYSPYEGLPTSEMELNDSLIVCDYRQRPRILMAVDPPADDRIQVPYYTIRSTASFPIKF